MSLRQTWLEQLRGEASTLAFVAVEREQVVGHIFFSPVTIEGTLTENARLLELGPIAVLPAYQQRGIGALLIQHSLAICRQLGYTAVVVLGDPAYYTRFGFSPAYRQGLTCEYSVPDEAFMVLELMSGALEGCHGIVKYRAEFSACE